jgi:hypothetical protein
VVDLDEREAQKAEEDRASSASPALSTLIPVGVAAIPSL